MVDRAPAFAVGDWVLAEAVTGSSLVGVGAIVRIEVGVQWPYIVEGFFIQDITEGIATLPFSSEELAIVTPDDPRVLRVLERKISA